MKKYLLILSLIFVNITYARVGFAESTVTTPNGHYICHCDPYSSDITPVLIGFESKLKNLKEWYYYKDYIIGKNEISFFIFNEIDEIVILFNDESKWLDEINKLKLKPKIYTRWIDIGDSQDWMIISLIIISIPFFIILLIEIFIVIYLFKKGNKTKANMILKINGIIFLILTLVLIYLFNPISI